LLALLGVHHILHVSRIRVKAYKRPWWTSVAASFHRPSACVHESSSGYDDARKFVSTLLGCDNQYSQHTTSNNCGYDFTFFPNNAIAVECGCTCHRDGNVVIVSTQQANCGKTFLRLRDVKRKKCINNARNVATNTAGKQAGGFKWEKIIWRFRKIAKKQLLASSHLSVRPHGITRLSLAGFLVNLIFQDFSSKICQ